MHHTQSLHIALVGSLGIISACSNNNSNTNTSATGGGGEDSPGNPLYDEQYLRCGWQEPGNPNFTYEKHYCLKIGVCDSTAGLAQICAYNVDGTIDTASKYEDPGYAILDGWCYDTCPDHEWETYAGRLPPSCSGVDPTPFPSDNACLPEPESGTGTDSGTGTESGTPTTGDSGLDTDGPEVELWLCSQYASDNCQVRDGDGILVDDDHCWSATTMIPQSKCVMAADAMEAEEACECLCTVANTSLSGGCDGLPACEVTTDLVCTVPYPDAPVPFATLSGFACEMDILPAATATAMCDNSPFKLFDLSASLTAGGIYAGLSGIVGYIDYNISTCSGGMCAISVDVLGAPPSDVVGFFLDTTQSPPATNTFAIDDLGFVMIGTLEGLWNQSTGSVTFATDTFLGNATMSAVTLNSSSIPSGPLTTSTTQVVGNLTSTASLSLSFTFNVPGGSASLTLMTR